MANKFRLVGATNGFPDHLVIYSNDASPTITETIRRGVAPRDIKRRYCYLEIQQYSPGKEDSAEYDVVDSWSDESRIVV